MYCVTRRYSTRSIEESGRRAETGLSAVLQRNPGFRGYYLIDGGEGIGLSITVFESQEAAERSRQDVLDWIENNVSDLFIEPALVTSGEVVVTVEAQGAPGREAAAGATAQPAAH